jgi:lipopolysaccharide biosynthesis glycosyltransferase
VIFVFAFDAGFALPTGVAVRSLDRFLSGEDRIVLLHDAVQRHDLDRVRSCASSAAVSAVDCHAMLERAWRPPGHVTNAAFLRYVAPRILEGEARCVYLDGDVVVRGDPRPLHDAAIAGTTLGAVRSRVAPFIASAGAIGPWLDMGLPSAAPYLNSGVLVMDLDRWRRRDVTARITDVMTRYGDRLALADQDALNAAVVGDWTELDRTWNFVTHVADSFLQQPELEPTDPSIVHFAGRAKPWVWGPQPLFAEEWHGLLGETPWKGFAPSPPAAARGVRATSRRLLARGLRRLRDVARS